jgi:hypothetical protein
MSTSAPLDFWWRGDAMVPRNLRAAERQYTLGEVYRLEHREDRSAASHGHFFASLAEAHANLPDHLAERFATPDHLRKHALCMTGWRDERSIVCSSKAEARRLAAFIAPMDEYAIISVTEAVVVCWTAKSQSVRAMGKAAFQKSKDDVLGFIASLIGTTPEALSQARAA